MLIMMIAEQFKDSEILIGENFANNLVDGQEVEVNAGQKIMLISGHSTGLALIDAKELTQLQDLQDLQDQYQ